MVGFLPCLLRGNGGFVGMGRRMAREILFGMGWWGLGRGSGRKKVWVRCLFGWGGEKWIL